MDCRWLMIAWKAGRWLSEKGWYRHNIFCGFHVYSRFLFWNCFCFLTNRFTWGWKILILDSWGLSLTSIEFSFGYPLLRSASAPLSVPLQRCIPILTPTAVSLFLPVSFLLTASIFAIFLVVFRKAIIRAPWSSLPLVSKWKPFPLLFKRETAKQGNSFSFIHSPNSPLSSGLPRLPPGTPEVRCLRPKHFPVSKLAEHEA